MVTEQGELFLISNPIGEDFWFFSLPPGLKNPWGTSAELSFGNRHSCKDVESFPIDFSLPPSPFLPETWLCSPRSGVTQPGKDRADVEHVPILFPFSPC